MTSVGVSRFARAALTVAVLGLGCRDGTGPGVNLRTPFIASVVRATPETPAQVYVSLPSDSIPDGTSVTLRHQRTGVMATVPMIEGGFDPVAIPAATGDTIVITVAMNGGSWVTYDLVVPKVSRPVIVRTYPPKQKRDVPLNASMMVVFSTPIDAASLHDGSLRLRNSSADASGDIEFGDPTHTSIRFTPERLLDEGTDYEFIIAPWFRDLEGNTLESGLVVSFRTLTPALKFSVQPTLTVTVPPDVPGIRVFTQVIARDATGAIDTDFNGVVWIELENSVSGKLTGKTVVQAEDGIATFLDLHTDAVGVGHRLRATAVGFGSASSASFNAGGSVSVRQSGIAYAGVTLPPVEVEIFNASGTRPVSYQAPVTLSLAPGSTGTLSGTTTVQPLGGVVTFSDVQIDGSGDVQLMASTSGIVSLASAVALQPVTLEFTSLPANALSGQRFVPVTVSARTQSGALLENFTGEITLTLGANPANGVLTGSRTVRAVGGVATFSDLAINAIGSGYTLVASRQCCSQAPTISPPFDIVATSFTFVTQPRTTAAAATIAPAIQVAATGNSGETVTSYNGPITIAVHGNPADTRLSGTLTVAAVNGVATFADLSIDRAGNAYALTARGPGYATATSTSFSITSPWMTLTPMPTARVDFATAVVNGIVYVMGGRSGSGTSQATVEAYDPVTNSWSTRAPMLSARSGLGAGVVDGILYAVGGINDSEGELSDVDAYDPATNTWSRRSSIPATLGKGHSVAVFNGVLYIVSAFPAWWFDETSLNAYDPRLDQWSVKAAMGVTRTYAGVGVANGLLYAIGGDIPYTGNYAVTGQVEAFDPLTNTWFGRASLPLARSRMGVAVSNEILYAVGGRAYPGRDVPLVDRYDPVADEWRPGPTLPGARRSVGAVFINGVLYVIASTPPAMSDINGAGTETYGYRP